MVFFVVFFVFVFLGGWFFCNHQSHTLPVMALQCSSLAMLPCHSVTECRPLNVEVLNFVYHHAVKSEMPLSHTLLLV